MNTHVNIINEIIETNKYLSYLEIGCENNEQCFNHINAVHKVGVDPISGGTLRLKSNDFFKINLEKFDVIFIDGLHEAEQVYADILNSLECSNNGGTILCHDLLPTSEIMQIIPRMTGEWTGDGWRAWVRLRQERDDLNMYVIDVDYGIGIIKKSQQELLKIECCINYDNFVINKKIWMNII